MQFEVKVILFHLKLSVDKFYLIRIGSRQTPDGRTDCLKIWAGAVGVRLASLCRYVIYIQEDIELENTRKYNALAIQRHTVVALTWTGDKKHINGRPKP